MSAHRQSVAKVWGRGVRRSASPPQNFSWKKNQPDASKQERGSRDHLLSLCGYWRQITWGNIINQNSDLCRSNKSCNLMMATNTCNGWVSPHFCLCRPVLGADEWTRNIYYLRSKKTFLRSFFSQHTKWDLSRPLSRQSELFWLCSSPLNWKLTDGDQRRRRRLYQGRL